MKAERVLGPPSEGGVRRLSSSMTAGNASHCRFSSGVDFAKLSVQHPRDWPFVEALEAGLWVYEHSVCLERQQMQGGPAQKQ